MAAAALASLLLIAPVTEFSAAFNATSVRPGSVFGPDVSHYQGAVDWKAVKAAGAAFAFAKASEGLHTNDDQFASNWRASRALASQSAARTTLTIRRRAPRRRPPTSCLRSLGWAQAICWCSTSRPQVASLPLRSPRGAASSCRQ